MCAVKLIHLGASHADLREYEVEENSYSPKGAISGLNPQLFSEQAVLRDIAIVCSLNNKASLKFDGKQFQKYGEPTEAALRVIAEKIGAHDSNLGQVSYEQVPTAYGEYLEKQLKKVATLDFSSERKSMSTVVTGLNGNSNSLLLKGAPERVIEKCASYKLATGQIQEFTPEQKKELIGKVQQVATQGLRCLAMAVINDGGKLKNLKEDLLEDMLSDLNQYNEYETGGSFLGVVCIRDPPRQEVKAAI
mmetsp:Transcript_35606/g.34628  ORF Transcript_35606/g.34628 Transcript_35606/m.34628 type:complete len:248 (-) Transcript_35606:1294-2037(-)